MTAQGKPQAVEAIREGDVFQFRYSDEYRKTLFEPNHCFDGRLIATREGNGMLLVDSYWLHQYQPRFGERGKCFTEEDVQQKGELTFVCNIGDVEKVEKSQTQYYDDADVFDLSYQHGCYAYHAIRKGAVRSKEKMLLVVNEKMQAERRAIECAVDRISRLTREKQKIEEGRLEEVYL